MVPIFVWQRGFQAFQRGWKIFRMHSEWKISDRPRLCSAPIARKIKGILWAEGLGRGLLVDHFWSWAGWYTSLANNIKQDAASCKMQFSVGNH
jgi:hypothetical protein